MDKQRVTVHERVTLRHPEVSEQNVLSAWTNRLKCQVRIGNWPPQYVSVGFDDLGRPVEMVAVYDPMADEVLIFHAKVGLSDRIRKELGIG